MPKRSNKKRMPTLFKKILTQPKYDKQKHERLLLEEKTRKKKKQQDEEEKRRLGPSSDEIEDWYLAEQQRIREEKIASELTEKRRIDKIKKIRAEILHQRQIQMRAEAKKPVALGKGSVRFNGMSTR